MAATPPRSRRRASRLGRFGKLFAGNRIRSRGYIDVGDMIMKNRIRTLALAVSMVSAALVPVHVSRADDGASINDQLRDAQTQQERLKAETAKVGQELDDIIAEFKSNGLEGGSDEKNPRCHSRRPEQAYRSGDGAGHPAFAAGPGHQRPAG